jgi:CubicO group peptidase (beta-lactamase class C family)
LILVRASSAGRRRVYILVMRLVPALCGLVFAACHAQPGGHSSSPPHAFDEEVRRHMTREDVAGLALAVIDDGRVVHVATYGVRSRDSREPLTRETVMPAASFTKTAVAYLVLALVDQGRLDLDRPLVELHDFVAHPRYRDLKGDERARALTARHVLAHTTGFANFRFTVDDGYLRFHAAPGSRYGYSGEGFLLLQAVLTSAGIDVAAELTRLFERWGMTRSRMTWDAALGIDVADGHDDDGKLVPFRRREEVDASGSLVTTIDDQARLWAAMVRGDGLSPSVRHAFTEPQIPIRSRAQFPTLARDTDPRGSALGLGAGLGVIVFDDPTHGRMWFKGGHDDGTGNFVVCQERGRRCVVLLSNSTRAERIYPALVQLVLGETAMPWWWEYRR